jgi:hypothetical protein
LACQAILELRSEEQHICYTRNSYTEKGGGEVGYTRNSYTEIGGGEVGNNGKVGRYAGF